MIPVSTKQGTSVFAFPDVCRKMDYGRPVAAAYPNMVRSAPTASKVPPTALPPVQVGGGTGVGFRTVGDEAASAKGIVSARLGGMTSNAAAAHLLRNKLNRLNQQLTSLPGSNPDHWHELVDEYVQTTANLYTTLAQAR